MRRQEPSKLLLLDQKNYDVDGEITTTRLYIFANQLQNIIVVVIDIVECDDCGMMMRQYTGA